MINEDIFVETQSVSTDYETERNKPMPNRIHSSIQAQIIFLLRLKYGNKFQILSELSLDTIPGSTPDLCIFPIKKLDIRDTAAKEKEAPLTTIEIISPSQTFNELMRKAWDLYFPMGVKSSWIVVPELKAIHIIMPNEENNLYFSSGILKDPTTGVEVQIEKVFEDLL